MNREHFKNLIERSEDFMKENSKYLFQICLKDLNLKLNEKNLYELLMIEFIPIYLHLLKIANKKQDTIFLGIAGVNGSGKTTLSRFLSLLLQNEGYYAITFSMDDLYPTKEERLLIAKKIDPALKTRLMYDNMLVKKIFNELNDWKRPISIPKFDKSIDDRFPESHWQKIEKKPDFVIIEGVFTFAQPVSDAELSKTDKYINSKVRDLSNSYNFMDLKIVLLAESIENVIMFRKQQEIELRKKKGDLFGMDPKEVENFILYFKTYLQRYTWVLENNPIIDFVYIFNSERKITKISSPKYGFIY
ncbi:MAG: hypothetical protein ACTSWX_10910 [Promethearchaeota archaeon]